MSRSHPTLPILAALAGVACLSLMDALMKHASLAVGVFSATWLRSLLGVAIVLPVWAAQGMRVPPGPVMRLHLLRGVLSAFMALTFFYAITKLPIAETIAISFVAPLIALYLARIMLGEEIRRSAVAGSVLGFIGTIVIIGGRMGSGTVDRDILLGLASILVSAMLYAYSFIVIRRQSQLARPGEVALFHSLVPAVLLALAAPFLFTMPDGVTLGFAGAAALLTVAGAMALAFAYARAEAQVLVPMEYSGFLWASLFGWLFFREAVAPATILGTALIVAGCWIAARGKEPEQVAI